MQEVAEALSDITATSDVDQSTFLVTSSIIEDLTQSAIEDEEVRYTCIKMIFVHNSSLSFPWLASRSRLKFCQCVQFQTEVALKPSSNTFINCYHQTSALMKIFTHVMYRMETKHLHNKFCLYIVPVTVKRE